MRPQYATNVLGRKHWFTTFGTGARQPPEQTELATLRAEIEADPRIAAVAKDELEFAQASSAASEMRRPLSGKGHL